MSGCSSWQELKAALKLPAAASFKHVSPAGEPVMQQVLSLCGLTLVKLLALSGNTVIGQIEEDDRL